MSAVRPEVKGVALLAFLTALAASYFYNTPLPLFIVRLLEILTAGFVLWSAGGYGTLLLRQTRAADNLNVLERFLFAEVIGLGILSTAMILLGVAHAWVPAGAWGLVLLGIALSLPFCPRSPESFFIHIRDLVLAI